MKLDIFEGFRRLNIVVLLLILIIGVTIALNQSVYIDGKNVYFQGKNNDCIYDYTKTEYLNHGVVSIKYCFDKDYSYGDKSEYAESEKLTNPQIANYESQLFDKWKWDVAKGIGFTFLTLLAYFLFCKAIKFIASGFANKQ